jgi:hypothetical protein
MPRSTPSSPNSSPRLTAGLALHQRVRDAARSPDAFLEFCFTDSTGRPVRQAAVHRELQAFLTAHPKGLVELPRDHGKSMQVCGRVLWELGRRPGLRVKLVCATDQLAADRTRFLREAVADNRRVRLVFPRLTPARPWAAHAFTVARPASAIGPSVAAFGVGAGSTGARADLLVCDDIVDVRCLHSKGDRDRVADYFTNNLLNLLEPDGRFWGLSTPWHADDLNARLKRNPAFAVFRRAVGPNLEPVWPEKWPPGALAERLTEIGAAAFARGYRLLPIDEGEVFIRPEWVKFWTDELPRERFEAVVLAVDPAVTAKATADASALVVLGRVADSTEVRVLEAVGRRVAAPDLVRLIDDADRRWRPRCHPVRGERGVRRAARPDAAARPVRPPGPGRGPGAAQGGPGGGVRRPGPERERVVEGRRRRGGRGPAGVVRRGDDVPVRGARRPGGRGGRRGGVAVGTAGTTGVDMRLNEQVGDLARRTRGRHLRRSVRPASSRRVQFPPRPADEDGLGRRADDPDEPDAGLPVVGELLLQLLGQVVRGEDFDGQVRGMRMNPLRGGRSPSNRPASTTEASGMRTSWSSCGKQR